MPLSRRSLFGLIPTAAMIASCSDHVRASKFHGVGSPVGTTLEYVNLPASNNGYSPLSTYPGWPVVLRSELATRQKTTTTSTSLLSFVQITDAHLLDGESPLRVDFLEGVRVHELLTKHGFIAMINRIRSLSGGPHTGRKFDCVISTGDQTDNHETIELEWFFSIMNGGTFIPKSGDPHRVDSIQNWGSPFTWQPDNPTMDIYKKEGFPYIPDFMTAICAPISSYGLPYPWYSVFGNHDSGSFGGKEPPEFYAPLLTGEYKANISNRLFPGMSYQQYINYFTPVANAMLHPESIGFAHYAKEYDIHRITPDERRAPFNRYQYIKAHLDPRNTGAGPVGHGYGEEGLESGKSWSMHTLGDAIRCIFVDSTSHWGSGGKGSIGHRQLKDIERELIACNSRYYDVDGTLIHHDVTDQLCLIFSHHTVSTMNNTIPDPAHPNEKRYSGEEFLDMIYRFPNVIAWINGHEHRNKIRAHHGTTPDRSLWEITTASHIDFPQQSRIIEIADNHDGTLSIYTTLIESDAPTNPTSSELTFSNLASLYRQIAANTHAPWKDSGYHVLIGGPLDHNTELIINNPLAR